MILKVSEFSKIGVAFKIGNEQFLHKKKFAAILRNRGSKWLFAFNLVIKGSIN